MNIADTPDKHVTNTLRQRRANLSARLSEALPGRVGLVLAGVSQPRNYRGNPYPYRCSSHVMHLAGVLPEGSALVFDPELSGEGSIYIPEETVADELWHGKGLSVREWGARLGCPAYPLSALERHLQERAGRVVGLPQFQARTVAHQEALMGRPYQADEGSADVRWARLLVEARLCHDQLALRGLREAARLTAEAHKEGLKALGALNLDGVGVQAPRAHLIKAAMEAPLTRAGATPAYTPIITPHGEVLHQHDHSATLSRGDLLLVDFGAELAGGGCGDVTRTWPVGGRFSPTQAAIYELVLRSLRAATERVRVGVEYRAVHQRACEVLTEGLCALGIFMVSPEEALSANAHALFFPHGVGHLLGLDVHDMEDLGDLAGYAPGRSRDARFGWGYLRLDQPLQAGMVVTVEPGFYQVPALLERPALAGAEAGACVNWDRLKDFSDVRGVRLEDDVLVTAEGPEVLSASIPLEIEAIEALMAR